VISERGFPFEVQIRTAEMHRVAEEGIAAHWKYKEGRLGADRDEQYFVWLRQLLEFQQEVRDPQEFLQNLKIELYPEEVYIFTPAGEVKVLPRGATPVDFAYSIHTDVGHQCVGSKVNGKMVPLRTRLRNGDIVQIVTAPGHHPSRDWLNFVVTSRARNKIKHYIHAEEKERSLELGRKLFEKEARRYGLNLKSLTEGAAFATMLTEYGYSKPEELFVAIGYGKLAPRMLLTKLVPQEQLKEAPESGIASVVRRVLGPAEEKIKVRGFDDLMVFRARCCNPIRGEKIVGYVTRGKGVSVHSASCPNVVNLLYDPERRIEVEWDKGTDASPYTVRLSLQVEDRKGILADVTSKIAGINTNIRNVEASTDDDQMGRIDMTVEISDVKHLQKVIKSLRSVDGVVDVERASR
jgi:GTP pyrophosphokinase